MLVGDLETINNMQLLNLTPHEVVIMRENAEPVVIPASGKIARVKQSLTPTGEHVHWNGTVPVVKSTYGEVEGLPQFETPDCPYCGQVGGVRQDDSSCAEHGDAEYHVSHYLVSAMVRLALPHRKDLFSPADFVRDNKGNIYGCRAVEGN